MSFSCTAFTFPCEELHLDRKLVRRESQRLLREALADTTHLEEDLSRSDDTDPVVGRALTGSHSHLCGLLGDRLVREHADPHLAAAAEVMDDRAPRARVRARAPQARAQRARVWAPQALVPLAREPALASRWCRARRSWRSAASAGWRAVPAPPLDRRRRRAARARCRRGTPRP